MKRNQDLVEMFHNKFGLAVGTTPGFPSNAETINRCRLIAEESSEFITACAQRDIVEVADALADLLYVVYGAACSFGIELDDIFDEVHLSNMTKNGARDARKIMKGTAFEPPQIQEILASQGAQFPQVEQD